MIIQTFNCNQARIDLSTMIGAARHVVVVVLSVEMILEDL